MASARRIQTGRAGATGAPTNGELEGRALAAACVRSGDAERLLAGAAERLGLSARAHDRVLKVARTIADLAASGPIEAEHIAEALQFRGDFVP